MTIQVKYPAQSTSKQKLSACLAHNPQEVWFIEPTPFHDREFSGATIPLNSQFPVVMDPTTRRRFATVMRRADGSFIVK